MRSPKKIPFFKLKDLKILKKSIHKGEKFNYVFNRNIIIFKVLIGNYYRCYTGQKFINIFVKPNMYGFKYRDFFFTKRWGSRIHKKEDKKSSKGKVKRRGRLVNPLCFRSNFWLTWDDVYYVKDIHYANLFYSCLRARNFVKTILSEDWQRGRGLIIDNINIVYNQGDNKLIGVVNCYHGPYMTWCLRAVKNRVRFLWGYKACMRYLRSFCWRLFLKEVKWSRYFKLRIFIRNLIKAAVKKQLGKRRSLVTIYRGLQLMMWSIEARASVWGYDFIGEIFLMVKFCSFFLGALLSKKVSLKVDFLDNKGVSARFMSWFMVKRFDQKYSYKEMLSTMKGECFRLMFNWGIIEGFKFKFKGRFKRRQKKVNLWFFEGKLPLSTVTGYIDYGFNYLPLKFSIMGVKIWMNKPYRMVGLQPVCLSGKYGIQSKKNICI